MIQTKLTMFNNLQFPVYFHLNEITGSYYCEFLCKKNCNLFNEKNPLICVKNVMIKIFEIISKYINNYFKQCVNDTFK